MYWCWFVIKICRSLFSEHLCMVLLWTILSDVLFLRLMCIQAGQMYILIHVLKAEMWSFQRIGPKNLKKTDSIPIPFLKCKAMHKAMQKQRQPQQLRMSEMYRIGPIRPYPKYSHYFYLRWFPGTNQPRITLTLLQFSGYSCQPECAQTNGKLVSCGIYPSRTLMLRSQEDA